MPTDPTVIEAGQRVVLAGRTGCGKTYLGRWFMLRSKLKWVVIDSKYDPAFNAWRPYPGLMTMDRIKRGWRDDKIIVMRPHPAELNMSTLDAYCGELHEAYDNFGTMIDEVYQVALGSYPKPGLTGLITRGRVRGQAVIMGMQRPAIVPRMLFSEADYMVVMSLRLEDDRERVATETGHDELLQMLPPRKWYFYNVAADTLARYGPVSITRDGETVTGESVT